MSKSDEKLVKSPITEDIEPGDEVEELSFDEEGPMGPIGGLPTDEEAAARGDDAGLTEASNPGGGPTFDDAAPETLIREDGARSPDEERAADGGLPADRELTEVDASEIGAGGGLDEAELGRAKPLDGKPWDGEADNGDR